MLPYAINKYSPIPIPIKAESQNDIDEDGIAELEAMLENAKIEGWMDSLKKYGSKAYNVAGSPMGREIATSLLDYYMPKEAETQGDKKFSELLDSLLDA